MSNGFMRKNKHTHTVDTRPARAHRRDLRDAHTAGPRALPHSLPRLLRATGTHCSNPCRSGNRARWDRVKHLSHLTAPMWPPPQDASAARKSRPSGPDSYNVGHRGMFAIAGVAMLGAIGLFIRINSMLTIPDGPVISWSRGTRDDALRTPGGALVCSHRGRGARSDIVSALRAGGADAGAAEADTGAAPRDGSDNSVPSIDDFRELLEKHVSCFDVDTFQLADGGIYVGHPDAVGAALGSAPEEATVETLEALRVPTLQQFLALLDDPIAASVPELGVTVEPKGRLALPAQVPRLVASVAKTNAGRAKRVAVIVDDHDVARSLSRSKGDVALAASVRDADTKYAALCDAADAAAATAAAQLLDLYDVLMPSAYRLCANMVTAARAHHVAVTAWVVDDAATLAGLEATARASGGLHGVVSNVGLALLRG